MWRKKADSFLTLVILTISGCGGSSPAQQSSQPPPPPPASISISPTSAAAGSASFTLTITGSNFTFTDAAHKLNKVIWSASGTRTSLQGTFVNNSKLTAIIPAALLTTPGTVQVHVEIWDEDGPESTSASVVFSVNAPVPGTPSISSIAPTSVTVGSPDLTLTITGSNFVHDLRAYHSGVNWTANGRDTFLASTFVSGTQLTAVIPAALMSSVVTAKVTVATWFLADETPTSVSNSVDFSVNAAAAATVSPALVTLGPKGAQQFVATMNGNNADATWEIEEGSNGGSITSSGLYTVPSHVGTFHVIATFVADPSKSAVATVTAVASGFSDTGTMDMPRSGHTAILLPNGKVLIVGGGDGPVTTAELFDPATATFSPTGSMTSPRYKATATPLANGKVLFTGGLGPGTSSLPRLNSAELYDPLTGLFSATGNMAVARVLHTATLMKDGKVLVAGGTDDNTGGGSAVASTELYDPSTGAFTLTGSMLTARAQHSASLLLGGGVLIAGGWNGHAADSADDPPWDPLFAELYKPTSQTFDATGSMSTTRVGHVAIRLASGKVLMLGGVPSLQNIHSQPPQPAYAELYDPGSQAFSSVENLPMSRQGYTATLLDNGQVLITGGEQLGTVVRTVELLDPTNGSLTATGGLVTGRKGHTATRLNDGRVLVTGGTDSDGNALASAEIYQ
jgi:hypothetical protein